MPHPRLLALLLAAAIPAAGQPAPPPATAPARPRYVAEIPAGFQKVTAGGHAALCEPADAEWVTRALAAAKPTTRPSTLPVDLLRRATAARAALVARVSADLALPAGDATVAEFYDAKLLPTLRKFDELKAPVYFLVLTRARLDELTGRGWGEPRFHYNRLSGTTSYDDNVMLALDRPMDDSVLPAFVNPKDGPDERAKRLTAGASELDTKLGQLIAGQSQLQVFNAFAQFIGERHLDPLKLRRDQQWLAVGAAAYLTAGYAAEVTGVRKQAWLDDAVFEGPRTLIAARGIDLLNPADEAKMKPGAAPVYAAAMRRKAVAAVVAWTAKAGDGAIPRTLAAVRKQPPADAAGLVRLVREVTGVDLTGELGAK